MESRAVDSPFGPTFLIGVRGNSLIAILLFMPILSPTVHFAGSHESVGVIHCRSEGLIYNLFCILCGSHDVNELEVVGIIDLLAINGCTFFSGCVNDLSICYKFFLVLP